MATDVARLALQIDVTGARQARSAMEAIRSGSVQLTRATEAQIAASTRLQSTFQAQTAATRSLGSAFRLQKNSTAQFGQQFQDIAVQAQMGTSAFVIFGQQVSQVASLFGPGGAILGGFLAVGAAIGGVLYSSLRDTRTVTEQLSSAFDELDKVIESTDNSSLALTERIRELAKVSRVAAQLELQRGLIAAKDAANAARAAINELTEDSLDTTILGDFEGAISQAERLERLGIDIGDAFDQAGGSSIREFRDGLALIREEAENLNDEFGISEESARELISSIAKSRLNPTIEGFEQLQEALFNASQSGANASFVKLASNLSSFASQAVDAIRRGDELNEIIANFDDALRSSEPTLIEYTDKVKELSDSYAEQAETLGFTERQTALYKLQRLEANGADREAVALARQQINASFDKIAAFEQEEQRLKLLREQYRVTAQDDPLLQRVNAQDRGQDIIAGIRQEAEAVRMGLDQEFAIRQAHAERVIALNDGLRLGVIQSAEERNRLEVESLRQRNEQLRQIEMQKYEIFDSGQMSFLSASENLFGNLAAIAEKGGKDQFDTWKAMASAQAAVSTALAVANALTAAPPPVNFALATSVGLLGAAQIAQIQATEYQGSYLGGGYTGDGPRTGGIDGRGGFPAILHPNETVIDNERTPSMGGGVVINIMNAPAGTRTETRQDMDGRQVIDIIVADMQSGGPASRSMQQVYGLRRQGR